MRRAARALLVVLALLAVGGQLAADEIDRYLEERLEALHIPGLTLAIVRDGAVVAARGYGYADLTHRVPATAATVYEIGSNTKQFTAVAVMMLVEEGKIGLDDPVTRYFPAAPPFWSAITVRHLLTHTGGIQNHVAVPGWLEVFKTDLSFAGSPGPDELLARFYTLPRDFAPGETWAYDNTGYILLGWILEQASGKSYWDLLQERIFGPLGMTSTRSTDPRPIVPHRANGYAWVDGAFENRAVLPPFVAFSAGSLLSTVEDLARWNAALDGDALLRPESRQRLWTPAAAADGSIAPFDYGFGWFVDRPGGHRLVHHSGGTPGFSSAMYRFPDQRLTVILLTNHGDRVLDALAIDVAGMVEPALRRPQTAPDPDPEATERVRTALASLLAGRPDAAAFTPPMSLFLGTATGRAFWQWIASHGELGGLTFSSRETRGADRVLRYSATLGGDRYWFTARLVPDGRISQLYWW